MHPLDLMNAWGKATLTPHFELPSAEIIFASSTACFYLLLASKLIWAKILPRYTPSPSHVHPHPHRYWPSLSEDERGEWNGRLVAFVICVTASITDAVFWADAIETNTFQFTAFPFTKFFYNFISAMTGYLIYDVAICLFLEREISYTYLSHHIAGIISHVLVLSTADAAGYDRSPHTHFPTHTHTHRAAITMGVYMAEGSTPFFHLAWMIDQLRAKPEGAHLKSGLVSLVFNILSATFVLTFFLFRVVASPIVLYYTMTDVYPAWVAKYSLLYGQVQAGVVVFFVLLNLYWFYVLLREAAALAGGGKVCRHPSVPSPHLPLYPFVGEEGVSLRRRPHGAFGLTRTGRSRRSVPRKARVATFSTASGPSIR